MYRLEYWRWYFLYFVLIVKVVKEMVILKNWEIGLEVREIGYVMDWFFILVYCFFNNLILLISVRWCDLFLFGCVLFEFRDCIDYECYLLCDEWYWKFWINMVNKLIKFVLFLKCKYKKWFNGVGWC